MSRQGRTTLASALRRLRAVAGQKVEGAQTPVDGLAFQSIVRDAPILAPVLTEWSSSAAKYGGVLTVLGWMTGLHGSPSATPHDTPP